MKTFVAETKFNASYDDLTGYRNGLVVVKAKNIERAIGIIKHSIIYNKEDTIMNLRETKKNELLYMYGII